MFDMDDWLNCERTSFEGLIKAMTRGTRRSELEKIKKWN
jgi:hypothetical protein